MPRSLPRILTFALCSAVLAGCMSASDTSTRRIVVSSSGTATPVPASFGASGPTMQAYVTGYSFWDNTPPGSAQIARPVIHRKAGGSGTYSDPVTVAVGHAKFGGRSRMDFPAGTRFYFLNLQK
ncbi:hypothetical protein [Marimonas lutisalis]|uniref:hypothetical protein n=1 Tax=Marimonas lutisalis TaxID=2545756 RepID=UPI001F344F35|nr:hypothetical protein [Marimonas lutisalis]